MTLAVSRYSIALVLVFSVVFYLSTYLKTSKNIHLLTTYEASGDTHVHVPRHVPDVDLRIIVLTFNRAESVLRCLSSLNTVDYMGDRVHVDVWIDRSKEDVTIDSATFEAVSRFRFAHGTVSVHNHTRHVGIIGQWLHTWNVTDNTREIALILEDDITVSRFVYRWLKLVHRKYDGVANINGFSTQGFSMKHGGGQGPLHAPDAEVVFIYPVLGSWGFSPSVRNWLSFRRWYTRASKDPSFKPLVPGILPTRWYLSFLKSGREDTMWTMWHIYHAFQHNEVTVYANFPNRQGLTINWQEKGLHYSGKGSKPKYPLLERWDERYDNLPERPVYLDVNGKLTSMPT